MKRLVLVAFLVAACGSAPVEQPQTITLAFKAGNTYKYTFHSHTAQTFTMTAMTMPITLDATASETVTVKSVDSSGVADLSITMTNVKVTSTTNGATNTTTIASETSEVKIGSDGRPVSFNGAQISSENPFAAFSAMGGSFFISAVLPDGPVTKGKTWSKTYDQTTTDGSTTVHIVSNSTYEGTQSVGGVNAAKVTTHSTGTINATIDLSKMLGGQAGTTPVPISTIQAITLKGTLTSDVTSWIDPGTHRLVQTKSKATDNATMDLQQSSTTPQQLPISGSITVKGNATDDLTPA